MSDLASLLNPKSLLFIGGTECDVAIRKTRELGFEGEIAALHPTRDSVGGIPCIRSLDELRNRPDAAFIAVKRELAIDVVRQCESKGVGGAVVYASGFAEVGKEGQELQNRLLAAARGMPIIGPNCYGFINYMAKAALWPDEHGGIVRQRGVAIITQSGNIGINFTMTRRGFPLAAIYTLGNQADVDIAAVLDTLADDPRITAIGLHIEGLKDPIAFAGVAARARRKRKPIVALKTGRSEQGAKVALSHTSSLAGSDSLYDAMFSRFGIARVHSVTAFVETLKFLHHGGPLLGSSVVSMSCSGGEAALVADMAEGLDLRFPPFDPESRKQVAQTLNDFVAIDNPLDYHTFIWNQEENLTATFSAVLSGGFDVNMLILDTPTGPSVNPQTWHVTAKAYMQAQRKTKARAAIVAALPECLPESLAATLSEANVAPMAGLDDALTAFEAAAFIGRNWASAENPPAMERPARSSGAIRLLSEFEAKQLLSKFGLRVPQGTVCKTSDAVDAARRIGYPVALKASGAELAHKTEAGGVALDLRSEEDVRDAALRMARISAEVLVECMVRNAVCELIVGVKHDGQFGLALVIGAGGVLTELLTDVVTLILPASPREIDSALDRLAISKLITGFRGKSGDRAAVLDAIDAIAKFAAQHAESLEELDVNPLLVLPPGEGAIAVDALIRLRETP